jgi:hypothetical protein
MSHFDRRAWINLKVVRKVVANFFSTKFCWNKLIGSEHKRQKLDTNVAALPVYVVAKVIVAAVHNETTHRHAQWEEHLPCSCLPDLQQDQSARHTLLRHFSIARVSSTRNLFSAKNARRVSCKILRRRTFPDMGKGNSWNIDTSFLALLVSPHSRYRRWFTGCKTV